MESTIHRPTILHNGANGVTRVYVDDDGMTLQQFGTGTAGFKQIHLTQAEVAVLAQLLAPECRDRLQARDAAILESLEALGR
jgi:hypothetical protein